MPQKLVLKRQQHINPDTILDAEDLKALAECDREAAAGELVPLEEVKKMLAKRGVHVGRRIR
jgi:hypothetical protein